MDDNDEKQRQQPLSSIRGTMVEDDVKRSLEQLEQAMQLIPHEEKAAYLEAKARCPWLVEKESRPMRFLHYDNFNVWEAARRLAKYWEMRKDFFGQDRAFRPMHQTGNGALSDQDLEVLSTGYASILPNDKQGRFMSYLIPSRLGLANDADIAASRTRIAFYLYSIAMQVYDDTMHSYSGIVVFNRVGFHHILTTQQVAKTMLNHMPLRVEDPFLVQCPDDTDQKSLLTLMIPQFMKITNLIKPPTSRIHIICAKSLDEIGHQFESDYGFDRANLPPECGGTWDMDQFRTWQAKRIQMEQEQEAHYRSLVGGVDSAAVAPTRKNPPARASTCAGSVKKRSATAASTKRVAEISEKTSIEPEPEQGNGVAAPSASAARTSSKAAAAAAAAAEPTVDRKRMLDRLHSKRKRIRRKERFAQLESTVAEKRAENTGLKQEKDRLEQLLGEAHGLVVLAERSGKIQQQQRPVQLSQPTLASYQAHTTTLEPSPLSAAARFAQQNHMSNSTLAALDPSLVMARLVHQQQQHAQMNHRPSLDTSSPTINSVIFPFAASMVQPQQPSLSHPLPPTLPYGTAPLPLPQPLPPTLAYGTAMNYPILNNTAALLGSLQQTAISDFAAAAASLPQQQPLAAGVPYTSTTNDTVASSFQPLALDGGLPTAASSSAFSSTGLNNSTWKRDSLGSIGSIGNSDHHQHSPSCRPPFPEDQNG